MKPDRFISLALAAAATLMAGCSTRPIRDPMSSAGGKGAGLPGAGGVSGLGGTGGGTFTSTRKVDMLFLIDNSSETRSLQQSLLNSFPAMLTELESSPRGLPSLRIAVVSSDMGAGDGSIDHCDANGGDAGRFQYAARGACTKTNLSPGATFISNEDGVANYTGQLADVFACIAALGENGCGFEHQLAAVTRALGADGAPPPPENAGFLRPDAYLFIMIVTNEDDCSAQASGLYDTKSNTNLASPLGPLNNFRCNEFGHLCNGVKPPRFAPTGSTSDTVTLNNCTSAEGAGLLTPVADIVNQIRSVKPFPDQQIVVAAVAGPAAPYTVRWEPARVPDTGPWPFIAHSCTGTTGTDLSWADPAVRIADWVQAFGPNALLLSACDASFAPALDPLGRLLNQAP